MRAGVGHCRQAPRCWRPGSAASCTTCRPGSGAPPRRALVAAGDHPRVEVALVHRRAHGPGAVLADVGANREERHAARPIHLQQFVRAVERAGRQQIDLAVEMDVREQRAAAARADCSTARPRKSNRITRTTNRCPWGARPSCPRRAGCCASGGGAARQGSSRCDRRSRRRRREPHRCCVPPMPASATVGVDAGTLAVQRERGRSPRRGPDFDDGAADGEEAFAVGAQQVGPGRQLPQRELAQLVGDGERVRRTEGRDDDALDRLTGLVDHLADDSGRC